jgi:hypothetical protein
MDISFVVFTALGLWAISATIRAMRTDGYRRVPTLENGRSDREERYR